MNVKLLRRPMMAGITVCMATSLTMMAQNGTPAVSTSSFYEPELNSLVLETSIAVTGYNAPTPLDPTVASLVAAGLAQLRSRIDTYDPVNRTYVGTLFLASPSEPMPAPAADLTNGNLQILSQSTYRVEVIYHVPGSPLSIGLAGRILGPTAAGASAPDVVPPGTPYMLTFSYPNDAVGSVGDQAASFEEISFLIPGTINLYAQNGVGSIIVTPAPVAAPPAANAVPRHR